jgi:hypothetical protein
MYGKLIATTAVSILALGLASGANAFLIDNFNDTDAAIKAPPPGTTDSLGVNGSANILQGVGGRNVRVTQVSGLGDVEVGINAPNPGLMSYSQDSGVVGNARVRWDADGVGAEAATLEFLGAGVDLTDAGADTGILLRVVSSDFAANITFTLYNGTGGTATLNHNALPASLNYDLFYEFDDFALAGGFVAGDFAAVRAIDMNVNNTTGLPDVDLRVDLIESSTPNPEPATLALFGLSMAGLGVLQHRRRRRS